jgi:hypothetical protein
VVGELRGLSHRVINRQDVVAAVARLVHVDSHLLQHTVGLRPVEATALRTLGDLHGLLHSQLAAPDHGVPRSGEQHGVPHIHGLQNVDTLWALLGLGCSGAVFLHALRNGDREFTAVRHQLEGLLNFEVLAHDNRLRCVYVHNLWGREKWNNSSLALGHGLCRGFAHLICSNWFS